MNTKKSPPSGFTLIELLTVIAIIGILAGILIPTIGAVKEKASMVASSSNMKQIATSFATFSNAGTRTRVISDKGTWSTSSNTQAANVKDWATVLAYHAGLTDAGLYFISSDEDVILAGALPRNIGVRKGNTFDESTAWSSLSKDTISYTVVVNMSPNAPASTTPLLWTKGLDTKGTWSNTSPWQGKGGHIAFMDGHTEFFPNLQEDEFKLQPGSAATGTSSTSNITQAIKTTSITRTYPSM
ncbi:MAG: prepilin-type N-terminal cleavage/methylation domain-containing protein [Lentimonas sp.]|jgi:prepilin-type N-terminal cleavage/methylation domain-containing protein